MTCSRFLLDLIKSTKLHSNKFRIQFGIPFTTVAQDIQLAVKLILIHKRSPIEPLLINRMPRDKITNFTVNNFLWKQQHFAKNYIR